MTATMRRSAWGLDTAGSDVDGPSWRRRAACRHTPDSHVISVHGPIPVQRQVSKALHVCFVHCEVRVAQTISGGVWWTTVGRGSPAYGHAHPAAVQPPPAGHGAWCDLLRAVPHV